MAWHEHALRHHDPLPAELRPADDVFERQAAHSLRDQLFEVFGRGGGLVEQGGFFLGEHAARGPEAIDDVHRR